MYQSHLPHVPQPPLEPRAPELTIQTLLNTPPKGCYILPRRTKPVIAPGSQIRKKCLHMHVGSWYLIDPANLQITPPEGPTFFLSFFWSKTLAMHIRQVWDHNPDGEVT